MALDYATLVLRRDSPVVISATSLVSENDGGKRRVNKKQRGFPKPPIDTAVVIDAKLASLGVECLSETLGNIISSCDNSMIHSGDFGSSADMPMDLVKEFRLDEPLVPTLQAKEGGTEVKNGRPCSFGGLYNFPVRENVVDNGEQRLGPRVAILKVAALRVIELST